MAKKFYETSTFKKQQAEWYSKLKVEGFQDIEQSDKHGIVQPQIFRTKKHLQKGDDYYQFCQNILQNYNFRSERDRVVFELHTEGYSSREIEEYLEKSIYATLTHTAINNLILRIKTGFRP